MTDIVANMPQDDGAMEDLTGVFGEDLGAQPEPAVTQRRTDFAPWHHPVKQVVRELQWKDQLSRFINDNAAEPRPIRLFTLPGPDLLDVRCLSQVCVQTGHQIEYFGFDNSGEAGRARRASAEAALRQAGLITDNVIVHPDPLEDIVRSKSHTAAKLKAQAPFDVINVDACDHLAYRPEGREHSLFDAIKALIKHQAMHDRPWLLWVTTRVGPDLLGDPAAQFQQAIRENSDASEDFCAELAQVLDLERPRLTAGLNQIWANPGLPFHKLYAIGFSKYLLRLLGQPNHPASLHLASAYAYRVASDEPDMLAMAFVITPGERRLLEPGRPFVAAITEAEVAQARTMLTRVTRLWNIDRAVIDEEEIRTLAVDGMAELLRTADYDLDAWRTWVREHGVRPLEI